MPGGSPYGKPARGLAQDERCAGEAKCLSAGRPINCVHGSPWVGPPKAVGGPGCLSLCLRGGRTQAEPPPSHVAPNAPTSPRKKGNPYWPIQQEVLLPVYLDRFLSSTKRGAPQLLTTTTSFLGPLKVPFYFLRSLQQVPSNLQWRL